MKKYLQATSIIILMAALLGCAAGGSAFVKEDVVPQDKALVYFYRPNNLQGAIIDLKIKDNDKAALKVQNGQYVKYFTEAGKHTFVTDSLAINKPMEIELESGKTYYIKPVVIVGMWTGTWVLNRVYEDQALEELKSCKSGKE